LHPAAAILLRLFGTLSAWYGGPPKMFTQKIPTVVVAALDKSSLPISSSVPSRN
jgi:hypothetical protein